MELANRDFQKFYEMTPSEALRKFILNLSDCKYICDNDIHAILNYYHEVDAGRYV